jgi:integrase
MPLKIYTRKKGGVYHYRGTVAGQRLRGTTGTKSRDIAEQIAAREEARAWKRDLHGPEAVLTFADAAVLYRRAGKPTRFLERIEDHWKDTLVKDIKPGSIRQMAIDLYPNGTAATRNRQGIVPCQAIINHAAESELCPFIKVKRFKTERKIKDPFTVEWVEAFCKHASPRLAALAIFMFVTGARVSEALRVQWDDLDLKARTVMIRKTKISKGRQAHLPMPLVVALANLPKVPDRPVFWYRTRNDCYRVWDTVVKRAGIKRLTFHSGRHGFATQALRSRIDPKTAAWLGGWDSIRHFMETYAHAIQDITLTDKIFDPPVTQIEGEIQEVPAKRA